MEGSDIFVSTGTYKNVSGPSIDVSDLKLNNYSSDQIQRLNDKYSTKKNAKKDKRDYKLTKYKIKRKSDPQVTKISTMLSTSLIIKSPETASSDKQPSGTPEKVNAFQFMMNSRHKSIGSNSPGKERPNDFPEIKSAETKEKIQKRKFVLEEWADQKGGKKRKIQEEAQEKYINNTLEKRAIRMKEMLTGKSDSNSKDNKSTTKSVKKRKVPVILSDSENSNDVFDICETKVIESKDKQNLKTDDVDNEIFPKNEKEKDNLKENLDDHLFSPSLKKTSLLHYFELTSKETIKQSDDVKNDIHTKSVDEANDESIIKVKLNFTPKRSKEARYKSRLSLKDVKDIKETKDEKNDLNNSAQFFEERKDNKSKKKNKKKSKDIQISDKDCERLDSNKENNKEKSSKETNYKMSENKEEYDANPDEIFPKENQSSAYKKKYHKMQDENGLKSSPRSAWRMKVRLIDKDESEELKKIDDSNDFIIADNDEEVLQKSADLKLAPIFLRKDKQKEDSVTLQAKRNFLQSGVPTSVKKFIKQQNSVEEFELDLFPKISHVQQNGDNEEKLNYCNLSNISFKLKETAEDDFHHCVVDSALLRLGTFTSCKSVIGYRLKNRQLHASPKQLQNIKDLVKKIKNEYSGYPVFKIFRLLREKCGMRFKKVEDGTKVMQPVNVPVEEPKKRKRGRPKKKKLEDLPDDSSDIVNMEIKEITPSQSTFITVADMSMWTEKYKPQSSADIIGNSSSVTELKTWLESWIQFSQNTKQNKLKRSDSNSSLDFCSDNDTKDSRTVVPENTIIIIGPNGSGKTSAIYALSTELNLNVIEINASSKRQGKRILLELQEATQSHQVKNADGKSITGFFLQGNSLKDDEKKLSLLLFEDVDIVFEDQDDGFISALTQLISTSKRPVILTSSDKNCAHLQKFMLQHKCLIFNDFSSKTLGTWLQVLCLVEGVYADRQLVSRLLDWNKGDVRKTILQLQFWVRSGGDQLKRQESFLPNICNIANLKDYTLNVENCDDENSNMSWFTDCDYGLEAHESEYLHSSCLETFSSYHTGILPNLFLYPVDLGNLWWNIHSLLLLKVTKTEVKSSCDTAQANTEEIQSSDPTINNIKSDFSQLSPELFQTQTQNEANPDQNQNKETSTVQISDFCDVLDSIAFADVCYSKLKRDFDSEPISNFWQVELVSSLSLSETEVMYKESDDTSLEISHWLLQKSISIWNSDFNSNPALPLSEDKRLRTKQQNCLKELSSAVFVSNQLDRKSLCSDYLTLLRNICRTENKRFINNNKRKNRFYHYLKGLNVHMSDSMFQIACNVLSDL